MWDYEEEIGRIKDEKLRPTVTYIQNGVERTLTLDGWNRWKVEDTIYARKREYSPYYLRGTIKKDISWIHFKNFNFKFQADEYRNVSLDSEGWRNVSYGIMPECKILCSEDTVCILENCRFFGDEDLRRGECLSLIGGSFQVVHTYLGCFDSIYTRAVDFDLVAGNFTGGMKVTCRGGNVSIHDCDTITSLEVDSAKKLTLENNFRLKNFCMDDVSELVIGSEQVPTTVTVYNMVFPDGKKASSICLSKLVLRNCELNFLGSRLYDDFDGKVKIDCPVIEGTNYTLNASNMVINGVDYGKNNILTEKSFLFHQDGIQERILLTQIFGFMENCLMIAIEKECKHCMQEDTLQKAKLECELTMLQGLLEEAQYYQWDELRKKELEEKVIGVEREIEKLNKQLEQRHNNIHNKLMKSKPEKYLRRGK